MGQSSALLANLAQSYVSNVAVGVNVHAGLASSERLETPVRHAVAFANAVNSAVSD